MNDKTGTPLFSVKGLVKRFPGTDAPALDGVSLDIYEGECLVVAGSNGSGKTVFMKIIAGLLDPSEGAALFRGLSPDKAAGLLRSSVGLVFQGPDAQFIGETVAEDIAFGPKNQRLAKAEIAARVQSAMNATGLEEKADSPPRRLSGGEKRRLAVAGVLAMGCGTVIMDEPFANLDWPGVVHVLEIIRDLKASGKTVIVLTHELEKVLAFAGRLVILHRGRVRDDGTPEAVLDRLAPEYGVRDPRRAYRNAGDCTWLD